ncbi:class I adenylate-forming enzyme family protein [Defluviimonas salinarum]|uniref:AMP-binding protein n=1 Tax=Defluviimonas salinarum TaxID=2992147 RepID=A0ABT3J718_9RHOB|nr:AMP-binding protein [Defluviimonas salinarum]MCW3783461.1 AMP-binding protein [Defluviimonas salinarum]
MLEHVGHLSVEAARKFGSREALVFEDRTFSFAELEDLIGRAAAGLEGIGVGMGDVVSLYASNSWEWVVSYHAVQRLGAVVNPVNAMLTQPELEYVANDCAAKAIILSSDHHDRLDGLKAHTGVSAFVSFAAKPPKGVTGFGALINSGRPVPTPASVPPDALSTIAYTSGTTGHPKGAMQPHKAVLLNAKSIFLMQGRHTDDIGFSALPLPHVYGNVLMNGMFLTGSKLVLHARYEAEKALKAIEKYRITIFDGVPTMWMFLLSAPSLQASDTSSLRLGCTGGQTIPVSVLERIDAAFGIEMHEVWGMTEIAGAGSSSVSGGLHKPGSAGVAFPYCEFKVVDPEEVTRELPRGETGELMFRGPLVMQGYWGNQAKTAETIEPDGWLHTGDLGSIDEDGCIYVIDRLKDLIITGGFNVYPAEIERVLAAHPSVALAAAGRQPDPVKGEIAKAYVILKDGAEADAKALMYHCRSNLAAYKCPRKIQFVTDVPRTSSGKIMRRELATINDEPEELALAS